MNFVQGGGKNQNEGKYYMGAPKKRKKIEPGKTKAPKERGTESE